MSSEHQRHRVLAGISRSRLLAVLRNATEPMGVRDLADAVDLHPNTAREHLDLLVDVGLVSRAVAPPNGRGRPGLRYRATPTDADDPGAYRALAGVLAEALAQRPDARAAATGAGEAWGRAMAERLDSEVAAAPVDGLIQLLDDAGFAPERPSDAADPIRLHSCPFGQLARERRDVVCGAHLGLMRGALDELGAPFDGVRLEPFVEPSLCLAHVGSGSHGR